MKINISNDSMSALKKYAGEFQCSLEETAYILIASIFEKLRDDESIPSAEKAAREVGEELGNLTSHELKTYAAAMLAKRNV